MTAAELKNLIDTNIPNNNIGLITPALERQVMKAIVDFVTSSQGESDSTLFVWDPAFTYGVDTPVIYNQEWYLSKVSPNQGNTPDSSPTQWEPIGSQNNVISIWEANVYVGLLTIVIKDNALYVLERDLVGDDPYVSTNFAAEVTAGAWVPLLPDSKPLQNAYADTTAMFATQSAQLEGYFYIAGTGLYIYLGTTAGNLLDYYPVEGGGSAGVPEAPADGQTYGRKDEVWTPITEGIEEAPDDNIPYVRKNEAWEELPLSQEELQPQYRFEYGGRLIYSGTGLVFNDVPKGFFIGGPMIEFGSQQITLAASDATHPRIDLWYVDALGLKVITGTPAAEPIEPALTDPANQLRGGIIQIPANATDLNTGIPTTDIYRENVEWTGSSAGAGTFNFASTTNPKTGTVAAEATNIETGSKMIFTAPANVDLNTVDSIAMDTFLKLAMRNSRNITLQWYDAADVAVSTAVNIPLDKLNTTTYQLTGLAITDFTLYNNVARKLHITYTGSGGAAVHTGWILDNVILQGGITQPITVMGVESVKGVNVDNSDPKNPKVNGIPSGGTTGQVLKKVNATDYNTSWQNEATPPALVEDYIPSTGAILFDQARKYGYNGTPVTGNITIGITGAKEINMPKMLHNSGTVPSITPPGGVTLHHSGGDYMVSIDNELLMICHKNDAGTVTRISYTISPKLN